MITENKLIHSMGVARRCRELAVEKNMPEDYCDAMFVMGLLHDVGYEDTTGRGHSKRSAEMIGSFLKYSEEAADAVKMHGRKFNCMTDADIIINTADMTVSYDGTPVTIEERVSDIKRRYGESSEQYKNAVKIADALKNEESVKVQKMDWDF